ncbi:hypothetical protein [Microbaculum marinisediminis]|uniref:Uncharacterized protein n=1 Tax=Microbaculum marinisediminis TaxID=2931392 RepID=A0AAW5QV71_9HYPH|nr:hypothetical protein [Microbaculum sp. A6E488]MCT8970887.1 hypothetical protein [Microbaculum sp. A6E488]
MSDREERIAQLAELLAKCEAEADDLGLELIGYLLATARRELDARSATNQ